MMRTTGVSLLSAALLAAVLAPSPASAFGLHLGPLYLGLPLHGPFGRHRSTHAHRTAIAPRNRSAAPAATRIAANPPRANPPQATAPRVERVQDRQPPPALLNPVLALPAVYDDIFVPATTVAWPFGYDAVVDAAFANNRADSAAHACGSGNASGEIVARITRQVEPNASQQALLQKLGGALGMADGYLAKACPKDIPSRPVARLKLMGRQVDAMLMALEIVHQPLRQFEQSLTAEQHAHLSASSSTPAPNMPGNAASACDAAAPAKGTDWPTGMLERSVKPTDGQRNALSEVRQAFSSAATGLDARCPTALPSSSLARLESVESRLDATWAAILSIQVALDNFQGQLSDQQRSHFDTMRIAATP